MATGPNTDVVAGPAGYVGTDWGIFSGCHISLSTDGVTWQALGYGMHFGGECDLSGTSKAYFVMVAMDAPSREGLWRSTNGLDWSLVLAGGGYGRVVEGADGSLLVGQRGADGDHDWRLSRDEGVTWNPVATTLGDSKVNISGMIRSGDLLIGNASGTSDASGSNPGFSGAAVSIDGLHWQESLPGSWVDQYRGGENWATPLGDGAVRVSDRSAVWIGRPNP